jgi:FkbM family methyltransferase
MGLLHLLHRFVSKHIAGIGNTLGCQSLPTRFNGRWLLLPAKEWSWLVVAYEPYIAAVMRGQLKRGDVVFDIGAHTGVWSAYAGRLVGKSGDIIACEPSPAYELLKRTARNYRQIRPLNIGIGAKNEQAVFHAQGHASSSSFVREATDINAHFQSDVPITEETVTLKTLDCLIDELGVSPDLIKVDVEGFEVEVIKGARKTLSHCRSAWIIEVHPPQLSISGGSDAELTGMLESQGYNVEIVNRNSNSLYTLVARKPKP